MEGIVKKTKVRGGHRAFATKVIVQAKDKLADYSGEEEQNVDLLQLQASLQQRLAIIQKIDEEILDGLEENEEIVAEIDEAGEFEADIHRVVIAIEQMLKPPVQQQEPQAIPEQVQTPPPALQNPQLPLLSPVAPSTASGSQSTVRVRLPMVEVTKFSGNIVKWQEFLDCFESAIDKNATLSDVDKFTYLRGYLEGPARSCIAGFSLTTANYRAALDLLKDRYGKRPVIVRAHIDELMKIKPVVSTRDTTQLRYLYDCVETHYRGLNALEIGEESYCAIVVPAVLQKLPESVRLAITRGAAYNDWNLSDLLQALKGEVDLREEQLTQPQQKTSSEGIQQPRRPQPAYRPASASALFTNTSQEKNCAFCMNMHPHENCPNIKNVQDRKKLIGKYGRCFSCLRKGHRARDCKVRVVCKRCNAKHHTSLCEVPVQTSQGEGVVADPSQEVSTSTVHVGTGGKVALQTAQALVKGKGNRRFRVLFDSASHKSFVTQQAVESLGLEPISREWLAVNTFGRKAKQSQLRDVVALDLTPVRGEKALRVEAFVVPDISSIQNENLELVKGDYPHLEGLWLSDVCRNKERLEVDVLIGADYLWRFQTGHVVRGEPDEPVAVETELGWVLSGPLKVRKAEKGTQQEAQVNFVGQDGEQAGKLNREVHKLWDLETLGIRESEEVYEDFVDSISFNGSRYSVKLPWKESHDRLPDHYALSLSRLKGQVRKLRKEPEVLAGYNAVIQEQLQTGVIEKVLDLEKADKLNYIPHLAVIRREAETTKLRVVYDASAKEGKKGTSLNDCLHVGPSLNPLLFDILVRFREKRVALIGDIEKAFLNIEVDRPDRDCLRFLWLDNVQDPNSSVVAYRFNRVVFGLNSSPFLLNATLRHHISKFSQEDPLFVERLQESFYVDDLVTGETTTDDAFLLYEKSKQRLASGGFKLRKWKTNDKELRQQILKQESSETNHKSVADDVESYAKLTLGTEVSESCQKVLGLPWDCEKDTINFSFNQLTGKASGKCPTKRSLLSLLASLFDPLGLISPVLVCMKILFQELCCAKLDWDQDLQGEQRKRWDAWVEDLAKVKVIPVGRCLYENPKAEVLECYLHGFGDASTKAYCAMVYVVCRTSEGIYSKLIAAKTRVAPMKGLSIPRLELMSALILARLMDTVRKALKSTLQVSGVRYWLDSKTALCWIQNRGEWKQFVRHRVNEILRLTNKEDWDHCPGEENPADIGSRGALASKLKDDELWWHGPEWLTIEQDKWPATADYVQTAESREEEKAAAVAQTAESCEGEATVAMVADVEDKPGIRNVMDIDRFSRMVRLIRVTAWIRRFIHNVRAKQQSSDRLEGLLSTDELIQAEGEWVKDAQTGVKDRGNFKQLKGELGLVEDSGILRCVGRMVNSDLEFDARRPVLLPKDHRLTKLVIEACHKRVLHSGVRATLAELRSRYWVPRGRQVVKKVLGGCVVCKKLGGKPYCAPTTAALPDFRVREVPPFSKVGVDFAGPLYVKVAETGTEKAYIALFSCCVTRAIHLELVKDLSAEAFRRALRRFTARRGIPTLIVSDNAKTFQATEKALNNLFNSAAVRNDLDTMKIEWKFNLERAPWWGGFFERMVASVKSCLRKVLGNTRLTFDELHTVLVEVEGTLNSRPLTYDYDEIEEEVLTPSHLIFGRRIRSLPDESTQRNDDEEDNMTSSERFRYLSTRLVHFWNRWRNEYLADLREYHHSKTGKNDRVIQIGDIVTVHEDNKKRGSWKMAVVESLVKGRDNVVRGANIRVITKGRPVRMARPIQKLYPIEVRSANERVKAPGGPCPNEAAMPARNVPKRAAAIDAGWKTRNMLDS